MSPRGEQGDLLSCRRDVDIENLVVGLNFEKAQPARVRSRRSSRSDCFAQASQGFRGMSSGVFYFRFCCQFQFEAHEFFHRIDVLLYGTLEKAKSFTAHAQMLLN